MMRSNGRGYSHSVGAQGSQTETPERLDAGGDGRKAGPGSQLPCRRRAREAEHKRSESGTDCRGLGPFTLAVILQALRRPTNAISVSARSEKWFTTGRIAPTRQVGAELTSSDHHCAVAGEGGYPFLPSSASIPPATPATEPAGPWVRRLGRSWAKSLAQSLIRFRLAHHICFYASESSKTWDAVFPSVS